MIKRITANTLTKTPGIFCLEKDLALTDNMDNLPHEGRAFKSEMLMLYLCVEGEAELTLGSGNVHLREGDAYVYKPIETMLQTSSGQGAQVWVLCYQPYTVDHILPSRIRLSRALEQDFHPLVHMGALHMRHTILPMLQLLRAHCADTSLPFQSNSLFHLFSALLFEVLNRCCLTLRLGEQEDDGHIAESSASRADSIYEAFRKALHEDNGCHRTVAYYANLLCISPKHLSKVIREKTGTRALDIINRYAIQQIKMDLKLTDLPIKQLAHKYHFTNFSFFCQYIKQHLGMTPQEYRSKSMSPTSAMP